MTHNDLRYEFGPYQLDPSKRILTRAGEGIPLRPNILLVLVKHAGQLVVVVLPFNNNTGDAEFDYLADGSTDNVINNLSRISPLRVLSPSAVFRYKSTEHDPRGEGKELRASAVLNFEAANLIRRRWTVRRKWHSVASLNPCARSRSPFYTRHALWICSRNRESFERSSHRAGALLLPARAFRSRGESGGHRSAGGRRLLPRVDDYAELTDGEAKKTFETAFRGMW